MPTVLTNMAPNLCSMFQKNCALLGKILWYFKIPISMKDEYKDVIIIFILNQEGVTPSTKC